MFGWSPWGDNMELIRRLRPMPTPSESCSRYRLPDAAINHPESFHYPGLRDGADIPEDDQAALPTCDARLALSFLESSRWLLRVETATVQGQ